MHKSDYVLEEHYFNRQFAQCTTKSKDLFFAGTSTQRRWIKGVSLADPLSFVAGCQVTTKNCHSGTPGNFEEEQNDKKLAKG